jgi:protein-S-isoprenylcysteine O-methyltransferase Ste14
MNLFEMFSPESLYFSTAAGVMTCWLAFAAAFIFRKRQSSSGEQKRDNKARLGILLEACGYAIAWTLRRKHPLFIETAGMIPNICCSIIAVIIAVLSAALVVTAVRTLGKQWAVAARVVKDHQLITKGPYNLVRNPIYSGMLGMLVSTAIAFSTWYALLPAIAVFWYGTMIRVKVEEQLLREAFGEKFDDYTRRTPALIPTFFKSEKISP